MFDRLSLLNDAYLKELGPETITNDYGVVVSFQARSAARVRVLVASSFWSRSRFDALENVDEIDRVSVYSSFHHSPFQLQPFYALKLHSFPCFEGWHFIVFSILPAPSTVSDEWSRVRRDPWFRGREVRGKLIVLFLLVFSVLIFPK
jgi:hypothetical protein